MVAAEYSASAVWTKLYYCAETFKKRIGQTLRKMIGINGQFFEHWKLLDKKKWQTSWTLTKQVNVLVTKLIMPHQQLCIFSHWRPQLNNAVLIFAQEKYR